MPPGRRPRLRCQLPEKLRPARVRLQRTLPAFRALSWQIWSCWKASFSWGCSCMRVSRPVSWVGTADTNHSALACACEAWVFACASRAVGLRSYPDQVVRRNHHYGAAEIHHNTWPTTRQPLFLPSTTLSYSWFSDSSSSMPLYLRRRDTHKPSSSCVTTTTLPSSSALSVRKESTARMSPL